MFVSIYLSISGVLKDTILESLIYADTATRYGIYLFSLASCLPTWVHYYVMSSEIDTKLAQILLVITFDNLLTEKFLFIDHFTCYFGIILSYLNYELFS